MKTKNNKKFKLEYELLYYAIIIAIIAATMSIIFNYITINLIDITKNLVTKNPLYRIGILIIAGLIFYFVQKKLNLTGKYGIRAVKHELENIDRQMMQPKNTISKICLTIVSIVTGLCVGVFGPTVHIGGLIGSEIAYRKNMSNDKIRILIGTGVAAAISAILRTPLFATIIVIELFFLDKRFEYIFTILTGSLVAVCIDIFILKDNHIYLLQNFFIKLKPIIANIELEKLILVSIIIGISTGIIAIIYINATLYFEKLYKKSNENFKFSAIALIITGIISIYNKNFLFLDISSVNNEIINNSLSFILTFFLIKTFIICLQLGFGIHGGNFKPGVYVGIIFSIIVYKVLILIGINIDYQIISLLTMSAMISSFVKSPLSAIILAIEVSGRTNFIIPIIFVSLISYFINIFSINKDVNYLS